MPIILNVSESSSFCPHSPSATQLSVEAAASFLIARLGHLIPTCALKKNLAFLAVPLEFPEANADTDGLSDGS